MKYIVDVPDDNYDIYTFNNELRIPWILGESNTKHWLHTGLKVTPYTEPDEKAIEDEVWDLVEDEVWELARLISLRVDDGGLKLSELYSCFGVSSIQDVMKIYSYQAAKAKYEAWKKEKDEIRVGVYDQVLYRGKKCIITFITEEFCSVMYDDGSTDSWVKIDKVRKTGKSFPQFSELLKQMKGECDEVFD